MMTPDQIRSLLETIVTTNAAAISVIQDLVRLQKDMITSDNVKALVDAITALIAAEANDKTALAAAQAAVATLTKNDEALADPALQASVNAALAAAAAAVPAPAAAV